MIDLKNPPEIGINDLAAAGLGIPPASFPTNSEDARAALVAETIRVGLHHLYNENGAQPVHQISLRNWVSRKLEGAVFDLFADAKATDYRSVLLEGTGGNLEFLGDVLSLSRGYLVPAPLRAVETSTTTYVLASGIPTALLGSLRNHVELTVLGRRLVGVTRQQLESNGVRVRSAEAFLGTAHNATPPETLLREILNRPAEEWRPTTDASCYQGETRDKYDFSWYQKAKTFPSGGGQTLSLWRNRVGIDYHEHWLIDTNRPNTAYRVMGGEWKRTCLALDHLSGSPRKVFLHTGAKTSTLKLNFTPWAMFWRWMHLNGARHGGRERSMRLWNIPTEAGPQATQLLTKVGLDVKIFQGDATA